MAPFGENLLKNPHGLDGLQHWDVSTTSATWAVENPPVGTSNVVDLIGMSGNSCFVTSHKWAEKSQLIHLFEKGFKDHHFHKNIQIHVEEWFCGRADSGCKYRVSVELLDKNKSPLQKITFETELGAENGGKWQKFEHTFRNIKSGLQYVRFTHGGQDTLSWEGNFGSKMTAASVRIIQ